MHRAGARGACDRGARLAARDRMRSGRNSPDPCGARPLRAGPRHTLGAGRHCDRAAVSAVSHLQRIDGRHRAALPDGGIEVARDALAPGCPDHHPDHLFFVRGGSAARRVVLAAELFDRGFVAHHGDAALPQRHHAAAALAAQPALCRAHPRAGAAPRVGPMAVLPALRWAAVAVARGQPQRGIGIERQHEPRGHHRARIVGRNSLPRALHRSDPDAAGALLARPGIARFRWAHLAAHAL